MSWLLAFLGFALLIILHELGHFTAAKAVGMRVERFALFFPPLVGRVRRGETEYAIGAIPLGGYVQITGMNPAEEIPPEVAHRAYYRQPVWKRIVVIGAGPAVNIVLAFLLLAGVPADLGRPKYTVDERRRGALHHGRVGAGAAARRPRHRRRRGARHARRAARPGEQAHVRGRRRSTAASRPRRRS